MTKEDREHSPPGHGELIRLARKARNWSPETAAARLPFPYSGSSWRHIEAGSRGTGAKRVTVTGRPPVVAAMAYAVGVTSDRLEEHNPEAAEILRELERKATQTPLAPDVLNTAPAHVVRMIETALEDVDPTDRPALLRELAADYESVSRRKRRQDGAPSRPRHAG
ncbi:helix-turn-helix domain-containing protein [Streptomyces sp. Amel2xC10]|uniref:helix-turn-helix domain-containing protein n=1 Tax=Streptomyces sp. Amel2xC10 TaxID=1305826 RepID=UPI000A08CE6D|nr:helix-turn-helix domain-containing protein [Streptomyces sp. Amel2xC10]SMF86038.1 Helix-turn-helix domain-containing protein [Streptomyces sp. Amel2xC10]